MSTTPSKKTPVDMSTLTSDYVDYDAVQRVFHFLTYAAMKKQVVMFGQAHAAAQGHDQSLVIRGHIKADDTPPDSEGMQGVINTIAKQCLAKRLPPLTVLITKEGRTVSQGFWKNSPMGDLSDLPDEAKRKLELSWRKECLDYFDGFSAMNDGLQKRINNFERIIDAGAERHPYLKEAYETLAYPVVEGVRKAASLSTVDTLIRRHVQFSPNGLEIESYNEQVFISEHQRNMVERTVVLPVGESPLDVFGKTFYKEMLTNPDVVYAMQAFDVVAVLDETQSNLDFNIEYIHGHQGWNFAGHVTIENLDTDGPASKYVPVEEAITVFVDPQRGTYHARCNDNRVTNVVVKITARKQ